MTARDQLQRARARIKALKDNLPDSYEVESTWVQEYHDAIDGLESELSLQLTEFRLPQSALYQSVASSNYLTGDVTYRRGMWCQVTVLLQKADALLYYLSDLYGESAR